MTRLCTSGWPSSSGPCRFAATPHRLRNLLVHFLRHAESASNAASAIALPEERGDLLTDRGWEQAREAAAHLVGTGATRIVSSPLRRARETASVLSEALDLPVVELPDLRELRESKGFAELTKEDQRLRRWSVWMTEHGDNPGYSYRGAESFSEMVARVERVQDWLLASGEDLVLAVTHGIFLRFFSSRRCWAIDSRRRWPSGSGSCAASTVELRAPEGSTAPGAPRSLALPDLDVLT